MRNPHGYAIITHADGHKEEYDTISCRHCQRMSHIRPKQTIEELGGYCGVCHGYVCTQCVGKGCDEVQRKLDRAEASYHARRSYGL